MLNNNDFNSELGKRVWRESFGPFFPDKPKAIKDDTKSKTSVIDDKTSTITKLEPSTAEPDSIADIFGENPPDKPLEIHVHTSHEPAQSIKNSMGLNDIVEHYKNKGMVGEEGLACAITLAAINGSSFGVEGFSGSGKTFIVDKLIELLPDVYKIGQSSNLAIFNDTDKINKSRFIYVPELQKAMQNKKSAIIEVIKDLTEGKDANRIVTSKKGNGTTEYSIKSGVTIIYTLAAENHFKKDEESSRRLIRFRTDYSKEHLDEIHEQKARKRYSLAQSINAASELEGKLKEHMYECMNIDYVNIIDPFSGYISELIPKTQKSVGYVDHYYSLLDACAKFHFNDRSKFEVDGEVYLLTNLEDHFNIFQMYFGEFIQTLKDMATDKESIDLEAPQPDWKKCFEEGYRIVTQSQELESLRSMYSSDLQNWRDSQVSAGRIQTQDYKTGQIVSICEDDPFQRINTTIQESS